MKTFDNYEISPCTRTEQPDKPGHFYFEICEPAEADVWTLYGHLDGEGAEAIGDFATREHAEQTFQRITGIPFTGSREIAAHLRVMHTGQELLAALRTVVSMEYDRDEESRNFDEERLQHFASLVARVDGRAA